MAASFQDIADTYDSTLDGVEQWQRQLNCAAKWLDSMGIPHDAKSWDIHPLFSPAFQQIVARQLATVADLTGRGLSVE